MWLKQNVDYIKGYIERHPESFKACKVCGELPTVNIQRRHDYDGSVIIYCERHSFKIAAATGDDILATIDRAAALWRRLNIKRY